MRRQRRDHRWSASVPLQPVASLEPLAAAPAELPTDASDTPQTAPIQRTETTISDGAAAVPLQPVTSLEPLPAAPLSSPPQPAVSCRGPSRQFPPAPSREARLPPSIPAEVEPPRILRRALRLAAFGLIAFAGAVLVLIILYRWVDPPASTLMLGQRLAGTPIVQRWVPLTRISPNLPLAVILSEDARFCRHAGVDWGELREAIESTGDGVARGGSTISMQVVKNLFLWPSKSYLRKAIEIPLAYLIEVAWPKQRILEIYLNIAEWGPGVFGAEAAARYHFRKPAALLGPREAALLAVSLPNPFERDAGAPVRARSDLPTTCCCACAPRGQPQDARAHVRQATASSRWSLATGRKSRYKPGGSQTHGRAAWPQCSNIQTGEDDGRPQKESVAHEAGTRRSADALKAPDYVEDKESGERRRPHHIDLKSGKYRGRQILAPKADV